jgi:hypothetical protein
MYMNNLTSRPEADSNIDENCLVIVEIDKIYPVQFLRSTENRPVTIQKKLNFKKFCKTKNWKRRVIN